MKISIFILLFSLFSSPFLTIANSQSLQREVCITVDDLPFVSVYKKELSRGQYITENLMRTFKKFNVIVLGSVISERVFTNGIPDSGLIEILNKWIESGMILGNHSYSHPNYNNISFEEFRKDITDGEIFFKLIKNQPCNGKKYFRHPYLFRGCTKEKADSLQDFLDSAGYTVAPVTIDNSDYLFSKAYEKAKTEGNDSLAEKIGNDYVNYMKDVLEFYENQSIALTGYNIKHILLCHANLLNADYMDKLLSMYKEKGYSFITLDEALKDKCFTDYKDEYYSKAGISWLHRWALSLGKKREFFKGEPDVPDYINNYIK